LDIELEQTLFHGLSAKGLAGHQSTADRNGHEYNGEYYGAGLEYELGVFYGSANAFKFFDNDDDPEGDTSYRYEVGITDARIGVPLKLGVWFQESTHFYQAMGANIRYEFQDLL
jgi:hypothetical protein